MPGSSVLRAAAPFLGSLVTAYRQGARACFRNTLSNVPVPWLSTTSHIHSVLLLSVSQPSPVSSTPPAGAARAAPAGTQGLSGR